MTRLMRILLVIGNVICIVLAILILTLSLGFWYEYVGGGVTILISIFGLIVSCTYNHIMFMTYAILAAIDLLIMIANGIVSAVHLFSYSRYCFDHDNDALQPSTGCNDWRYEGHRERTIAILVFLFVGVIIRVLNFGSSCLLAKIIYSGDNEHDESRIGETKRPY